jgi:hypothetical protein
MTVAKSRSVKRPVELAISNGEDDLDAPDLIAPTTPAPKTETRKTKDRPNGGPNYLKFFQFD